MHACLRAAARTDGRRRGHGNCDVVLDDLFFDRAALRPRAGVRAVQDRTVLFPVEATRRWAADGITANSLMPGGIFTNLQRHWDPDVLARAKAQHGSAAKTPEQGVATSVLLATSPALAGVGGRR